MQESIIEFFCHDKSKPFEVQLEPECFLFNVQPKTKLKFVARYEGQFTWTMSTSNNDIQLFPDDIHGEYKIEIYENDILLEDWYKYMRL